MELIIYKIKPSKDVLKNIKKLEKSQKSKIREFITLLKLNPIPNCHDIKKMSSRHPPQFRVRFGKFRLIYMIDNNKKIIYLLKLERREQVYKK